MTQNDTKAKRNATIKKTICSPNLHPEDDVILEEQRRALAEEGSL